MSLPNSRHILAGICRLHYSSQQQTLREIILPDGAARKRKEEIKSSVTVYLHDAAVALIALAPAELSSFPSLEFKRRTDYGNQ